MDISPELHQKKKGTLAALQKERLPWWRHWRELADFYLPRRYVWLLSGNERTRVGSKNPYILDGTGTQAARTLASGMMNGITSPSRPWFKLRVSGVDEEMAQPGREWLDEVQRRMLLAMAETNFYNSIAICYLDLVIFGTSTTLIYEDFESVFRCYNSPLGEFYLAQDARGVVSTIGREFNFTVAQIVERWGEENVSQTVKDKYKLGGANLHHEFSITHLIEPNDKRDGVLKGGFAYREYYWETATTEAGKVLSVKGYHEFPGICPRWELTANDSYGSSPAMDALGDVIQLQHETKKKAQGLDKMISPPIVADVQLSHKPLALLPNGVTFVAGVNNVGAKPIYTVNLPLDQMTLDIREVQGRIRETFHNDLFRMISQLDTVRSATEIDARREEKLVLLGPVLERFENEALDPVIKRIFSIMLRSGLLPEPPEELADSEIEIQYVSILTAAQSAVAAIPTERWLAFVGSVAAIHPNAVNIPNWEELVRNYGRDIGVRAQDMNPREVSQNASRQQNELANAREAAATGSVLVDSAQQLSETDVGGGANALQRIMGG